MQFTLTELVGADPERTFEVFSDFRSAPARISGIKSIEILTDGPVGKGTRFRETRVMFGRDATETLEITDFQPPRSYSVGCESCGAAMISTFTFTPESGGTRVSFNLRSRPITVTAKLLTPLGMLFAGSMKKMVRQDILDLKRVVEGEAAGARV